MDSHTTWISMIAPTQDRRFIGNFSKVQKDNSSSLSLKTAADQVIFTFLLFSYFHKENNIVAIICYNGLMKSDFVEKERKAMAKKNKVKKTLVEQS